MDFPLPEEFTTFVAKYFSLLEQIGEGVKQNNPERCIDTLNALSRVNRLLASAGSQLSLQDLPPLPSNGVKIDYSTLSLALYLEWCKSNVVKNTKG